MSNIPSSSHAKYLIVFQRANSTIATAPVVTSIRTDFKLGPGKCWCARCWTWLRIAIRCLRCLRLRKQRRRCERNDEQKKPNEKSNFHLIEYLHLGPDHFTLCNRRN